MTQPRGKIDTIKGYGTVDRYTDIDALLAAQKEIVDRDQADHWGWRSSISERRDTIPEFLKAIRVGGRMVRSWGVKCFTTQRDYYRIYYVHHGDDTIVVGAILHRRLWIAEAEDFTAKSRTSRRHAVNGVRAAIRRSEGGS